MTKWYDGYHIGNEPSMFNPNSVMQAIDAGVCVRLLVVHAQPLSDIYRVSNPFSSYPSLINPTFMSSGRYNLSFFLNSNTLVYFI